VVSIGNMNKANDHVTTKPPLLGTTTMDRLTQTRKAVDGARLRRDALAFLLRLAETDPAMLTSPDRPGDVLNFANDLLRFGLWPASVGQKDLQDGLADLIKADPKRTLDPLIAQIKSLLEAAADGKDATLELPAGAKILFNAALLKEVEQQTGRPAPLVWRMIPPFWMFSLGVPDDASLSSRFAVFVFNAMRQLDSEEGSMVRRCRRDLCRKLFLATRPKQIFCTRKCAGAVAFDRYKENLGKENYEAKHRQSAKESAKKCRVSKKRQQKAQQRAIKGK
jgi:hypothetical protein